MLHRFSSSRLPTRHGSSACSQTWPGSLPKRSIVTRRSPAGGVASVGTSRAIRRSRTAGSSATSSASSARIVSSAKRSTPEGRRRRNRPLIARSVIGCSLGVAGRGDDRGVAMGRSDSSTAWRGQSAGSRVGPPALRGPTPRPGPSPSRLASRSPRHHAAPRAGALPSAPLPSANRTDSFNTNG